MPQYHPQYGAELGPGENVVVSQGLAESLHKPLPLRAIVRGNPAQCQGPQDQRERLGMVPRRTRPPGADGVPQVQGQSSQGRALCRKRENNADAVHECGKATRLVNNSLIRSSQISVDLANWRESLEGILDQVALVGKQRFVAFDRFPFQYIDAVHVHPHGIKQVQQFSRQAKLPQMAILPLNVRPVIAKQGLQRHVPSLVIKRDVRKGWRDKIGGSGDNVGAAKVSQSAYTSDPSFLQGQYRGQSRETDLFQATTELDHLNQALHVNDIRREAPVDIQPLQSAHRREEWSSPLSALVILIRGIVCHADNAENHGVADGPAWNADLLVDHFDGFEFAQLKQLLLSRSKVGLRDPTIDPLHSLVGERAKKECCKQRRVVEREGKPIHAGQCAGIIVAVAWR